MTETEGMGQLKLVDELGRLLTPFEDIKEETRKFYKALVGQTVNRRNGLDIMTLRQGNQVSVEDRRDLIKPICEEEIIQALKLVDDKGQQSSMVDKLNYKFF